MDTKTKMVVQTMLTNGYFKLGIQSVTDLDARIKHAIEYLDRDREHYIEVTVNPGSECDGLVCKLLPMAQEITEQSAEDHVFQTVCTLMLAVSRSGIRFIIAYGSAKLCSDPKRNTYVQLMCAYAEPDHFPEGLQIKAPEEIRPVATQRDWDIFCMLFAAFERLCLHQPLRTIPRKTEQAMTAVFHTLPQTLKVDGKKITGKPVPLAVANTTREELENRHRSCTKKLLLLITDNELRYLTETHYHDQYFRKVFLDENRKEWDYKYTTVKNKHIYEFVELSDIDPDMHPLYY